MAQGYGRPSMTEILEFVFFHIKASIIILSVISTKNFVKY